MQTKGTPPQPADRPPPSAVAGLDGCTSSSPEDDYCLPAGYRANPPRYFADEPAAWTYQPHVYALAGFLAERAGVRHVVDLGAGNGQKLLPFAERFHLIAVDHGSNLERIRQVVPGASCIEFDLERGVPPLPEAILRDSVVIAADVVEHLEDPRPLLRGLGDWCRLCPYVLLSTPDRERVRGLGSLGPPANPSHVREWSLGELKRLLAAHGATSEFIGFTINTDFHRCKSTSLAVLGREVVFSPSPAIKPCAVVHAYNEGDIIQESLHHLVEQGCDVLLLDNWSTDATYERALEAARSASGIEVRRFPEKASSEYQWRRQLEETVRLAETLSSDWVLHNDADEFRYSPWKGVRLADGLAFVQALGYSAVDFTVLDFRYLQAQPTLSAAVRDNLVFFEFGRRPGHFLQVKGWRNQPPGAVDLASSGGHEARFQGRRVYPVKFLLRHYPLRSEAHARQKIQRDRLPRSSRERQDFGWHTQYLNHQEERFQGWAPEALIPWNGDMFATEYLVERMSGIGLGQPGLR